VGDGAGQQAELARLAALAAAGQAATVVVSGDPGTGKTRLLDAFARRLGAVGWLVLGARVTAPGREHQLLVEALDDAAGAVGEAGLPSDPADRAALAGIFPALRTTAVPATADGYGVGRAVRALLDLLATDRGLLLVLDDVEHADAATVDVLDFLVRHPQRARVLIVIAVRPRQADARLAAVCSATAPPGRSAPVHHLELGPVRDLDALAAQVEGADHELAELAGGNPGVLAAMVSADAATVDRATGPARWRAGVPPIPADRSELQRLSAPTRWLARSAAVVGEEFDAGVAAAVAVTGCAELHAALDELLAADVVRPGSGGGFRFRDPVLRAAAYHDGAGGWRCGAHGRAAMALAVRGASPRECAAHLEHAAVGDEAGALLLVDAARTELHTAPDRAVRWLRAARRLLPSGPAPESGRLLGTALALTGDLLGAQRAFAEIWPDLHLLPAAGRAAAVEWRARVARLLGRHSEAAALLRAALSTRPDTTVALLDRAGPVLELVVLGLHDGNVPGVLLRELVDVHRRHPDRMVRAQTQAVLACAVTDEADALAYARDAATLLDGLPDSAVLRRLEALHRLAEAERRLGDARLAEAHRVRAATLAGRSGQRYPAPVLAVPPRVVDAPPTTAPAAALHTLSRREREIADLVAAGHTNQQVATRLQVSPKTVETHLGRLFRKLDVVSRAQVAHLVGQVGGPQAASAIQMADARPTRLASAAS
jgi:DNA-binding CsgD family transcriptional regulator